MGHNNPFDKLWEQYERIIKDNGAIVLTASQPFTSALIMSNIKNYKYDLVWNKKSTTGFLNANKMPLRQHEDIVVFYKKQCTYNPQMREGKYRTKGGKKFANNGVYGDFKEMPKETYNMYHPTSIKTFSNANQKAKVHPTQKPVALFEYLIKTYTNEGDLVLDNCAGSGTTGIACQNLNRNCILMEKEEQYCKIIEKRLKENSKQKTLFTKN